MLNQGARAGIPVINQLVRRDVAILVAADGEGLTELSTGLVDSVRDRGNTGPMIVSTIAAGPDDWSAVRDIRLRALQTEPLAYCSSYPAERSLTEQDWQERLATARTFLAVDDTQLVVGSVTARWLRNGDMQLNAMYVAPNARGTGCAEALIEEVVVLTRARRGHRVVLGVLERNSRAQRCYQRFGFVATGRRGGTPYGPDTEIEYAYPVTNGTGDVSPRG